jgi:hypothetical protein
MERRFGQLFWRAIASGLRNTGRVLTNTSDRVYEKARPTFSNEERKLIEANEVFRNRHQGRRCFIIGNGPSIAHQDLAPLDQDITFVMNGFWKHEVVSEWQPTYFFFADTVLFDRSEPSKQFFDNVRQVIHGSTFFAPLTQRSLILEENLLPPSSTRFYAPLGRYLHDLDTFENFELTKKVPDVLSVAQLALLAAIFMGCSPIYLMGMDYDWLSHRGANAFYFFPGLTLNNHPDAAGKLYAYDEEMESLVKVWKGYRKLDSFAQTKDIKIFNATHGGFLDVFERVSYQSLVDLTHAHASV